MRAAEKLDQVYLMIEKIDYNHREGGKYAYVKFLSLTREILFVLQPLSRLQKERAAIESINWLFNEYLCNTFGEQQKVVFDIKRRELKLIVDSLKVDLDRLEGGLEESESGFLKAAG